jgi:hypothetical protein
MATLMKSRRGGRFAVSLAGAGAALSLAGCVLGPVHVERETRLMQVDHTPSSALVVRTENGKVEVVADPAASDISITAELRAQTLDRLERTTVSAVRTQDGTLRIGVDWADGKPLNSEGCSFDIVVPDSRGVDIGTNNGTILITGLAGDALLRTSNGAITANGQAGNVRADTSNGAITVTDPQGSVAADTSNGAIEVRNAPSSVIAESSNGRIVIMLAEDAPGPVTAATSNGRIELGVGRGFVGRLTVRTSNGRVSADQGLGARTGMRNITIRKNSGTFEFGTGGTDSTCTTSNGAIDVRPRGG